MAGNQRGEMNGNAKLSKSHVREIRTLAAEGRTHAWIAGRYGVSKSCITSVVSGLTWGDVE